MKYKAKLFYYVFWVLYAIIFLTLGITLQIYFFKDASTTILQAISSWPFLWVLYVFIYAIFMEHVFNFINRNTDIFKE